MIGIFGGTFDPVHFGHLRPALEVMQALQLDQVRFIPNKIPPHRELPWLDAQARTQLLQTAIKDNPGFVVDTRELERDGPSYMIDTLQSLRADFPGETLCLIMGLDVFAGLPRWHHWQQILDVCHLVVMTRPGFDWPHDAAVQALAAQRVSDARALQQAAAGKILLKSVTALDISSSAIRQQCQAGQCIRYLLPDAVHHHLQELIATHEN